VPLDDESMKIFAQSGEFANRKGIYPPLPGAEKIQYLQMEVLEAKAFKEKKKQLAKVSCASFRSENHCDSSTSERERWDSVLSPGVP